MNQSGTITISAAGTAMTMQRRSACPRENPAAQNDDETDEARTSKRGSEAVFPDDAQFALVHERGLLFENVW